MKKFTFFKKIFYKLFLQTRRMQFWQSSRRELPEAREEFNQYSEIMKKLTILLKNFSLEFFYWTRLMQFCYHQWLICYTKPRVFAPHPKVLNFIEESLSLSPNFPSDTFNPDFTNPPEKFRQKKFRSIKQFDEKRIISRGLNFWKSL